MPFNQSLGAPPLLESLKVVHEHQRVDIFLIFFVFNL